MTVYQKSQRANAERRRQAWRQKKEHVKQWLIDNDAPPYILEMLDEIATTPMYAWM